MTPEPASLALRLRALTSRRPGLAVCLWGEPGVGKTHTIAGLLRSTPCRSLSLHAATSPTTLLAALPLPIRWPQWAQRTAERVRRGQDAAPGALAAALSAQLAALSPFVLVLEDLHELDAERLALVASLAQMAVQTRGLGLLTTSRLPPPAPLEAAQLGRLAPEEAQALLRERAGGPLPPEAAGWIFRRAAGNPLFTLEYFRFLARQGALWNDGHAWHWRVPEGAGAAPLPTTVEALIELAVRSALQRPELQPVLTARALLGPDTSSALWAQVASCGEAERLRAAGELTRLGILAGTDFVHPLYREVLLRQLPPATLRARALLALGALSHDPRAVADLVERAGLPHPEALPWLTRAAQTAQEQGHRVLAARLHARACRLAPPAQAAELALAAAEGLRDIDLAEAAKLAELAAAGPAQFEAATWLRAELLALEGRLPDAEAQLSCLPDDARAGVAGVTRLIRLYSAARQYRRVLEVWEAHPDLQASHNPRVDSAVAFALAAHGRPAQAQRLAESALTSTALDVTVRSELTNVLGTLRYGVGDYQGAAAYHTQAMEQVRAAGLTHLEALYLSNRAIALGELGQFQERVADLETSLRLYLERGQIYQATRLQIVIADACLDAADYGRAEELLLESRDLLSRLNPSDSLIECEYRLSVLYRHWAPPHGRLLALRHAHAALAYARQLALNPKLAWAMAYAAIAESCFGDPAEGWRLAQAAAEQARQLNHPGAAGMADFALAHALEAAGQRDEALRAYEAVEAGLRAQGVEDAAQEVGLEADRLAGRKEGAARRLAWFEEAGLLNLAQVTRRYFPELAERPPSPAADEPARPAIRLEVLGELRLGGVPVRGRQRRALLSALLEARLRGHAGVSRHDLIQTLYPQTGETQALSALKELVHQTRAALGSGVIQTSPAGYALGEVASDAEQFLSSGETRLWRGAYRSGVELDGDEVIRDTLHQALLRAAQAALDTDPTEAARLGRLLCEADPYDPAALALTLQALRASGNHRSLGRVYDAARQQWREVGERLPEHWHAFLAGRPANLAAG